MTRVRFAEKPVAHGERVNVLGFAMIDSSTAPILAQLHAELGGDEREVSDGSAIGLTFDNGCEIVVTNDGARTVIESDLGPWPAADRRMLRLLLKNNYVWADLALQFSLRPSDENLIAARCLDTRMLTLESLKDAIASLARGVEIWKRLLAGSPVREDASFERDDAVPLNSIRI